MEAAAIKELHTKMYVNVAKKHQDVASLPGVGSNIQTPTSGKLFVHRNQGVIGEVLLPEEIQHI